MKIKEFEEILNTVQFRDYYFEIVNDVMGPRLFVFCKFMDREKSKEYYKVLREQKNLSPWPSYVDDGSNLTLNNPRYSPPLVPSKESKVGFDFAIPYHIQDEQHALDFIFSCIMNQERHEAEEDFYYRGQRVFDPHKK